jgi:hypothetical protein
MHFPDYLPASDFLNDKPTERVILTASKIPYFINNNDSRVLSDQFLDTFACLDKEHNDELTLKRLQQLEIRYVFFSKDYIRVLQNSEGNLKTKISRFVHFANTSLGVVLDKPSYVLLSVPN